MKLPYEYRMRQQLPIDICQNYWPELLELPFNEFTGFKNYLHKTKKYIKKTKRGCVEFARKIKKKLAE